MYLVLCIFGVNDSTIQVIHVYFCVDLWLLYAVTNTGIIFLVDSYSKCTYCIHNPGDRGGTVVKALCYKSEGRLFDPSWRHWNFSLT